MSMNETPPERALQSVLGHGFANPSLLHEALTHRSRQHGAGSRRRGRHAAAQPASYERLEFLGDRVLGLLVADMLMVQFPREAEGALARRHADLVRKETLAAVAGDVGLAAHIRLPTIEEKDARSNPSLLADVCEAVIAALYLDGGFEVARAFVARYWQHRMTAAVAPPKDPKTALQEWAQGRSLELPTYRLVKTDGVQHQPVFTVAVTVAGAGEAFGTGTSKRLAEAAAAASLLRDLES
jgi:ribonuclease-3